MISAKSVAVSLQDLRNSGALGTSTFLLKNEVPEASAPHFNIANSDPLMLNAAKISLLVARAFEKYYVGVGANSSLSLQVEDFSIHLGYSLPMPLSNGASSSNEGVFEPLNAFHGQEEGDASLQFISEFFDFDKPLPQLAGGSPQYPNSAPYFSFGQGGGGQQLLPPPVISFNDILCTEGFDKVWTLKIADCIPSAGRTVSAASPEQTLGDVIHFIFSGSHMKLTSTLNWQLAQSIDDGSNVEGRADKMHGNAKETLFSALVGIGTLPTSICRLLSDLLHCEDQSHTTPPISIQDAIQDLEHMCAYPQIYLYNPGIDFYSKHLLFGQRLYGRKRELTQLLGITTRLEGGSTRGGAECVFVSGGGGSGKSHFVNNVTSFLSNIGWIVSSASCGRDMAHRSSEMVLSLIDTLIGNVLSVSDSEGKLATDLLSAALDSTTLLSLSAYLPSLRSVSGNTDRGAPSSNQSELSQLQLTFLLPCLMSAILSLNRRIVLFLDNFEHVDFSALALLNEVLTSIGRTPGGRNNFLFIACYRDGFGESHPLTGQIAEFRRHQDINLTEMRLDKLSIDDVTDIIMTELRLPRRLVLQLASVVHQKTSGHALFVVQLLNSLVRDSVLAYSPMKRRFDWDSTEVLNLKTAENVANLIVSNLSSLTPGELLSLQVLSCFGMEVKLSVVALLKETCPYGGIEPHLKSLVEGGVVEVKDSSVVFTHDLIQQGVCNHIPTEKRRCLHLEIGRNLARKVSLDQHSMGGQLDEIDFYRLSFAPNRQEESQALNAIIGIAANQVNRVDPAFIERSERIRFARWNMVAASRYSKGFNFSASAHYCRKGIGLLYDCLWSSETSDLCRALHDGAASALLLLGNGTDAQQYANTLIDNLPFADSLAAQYILLRSLGQMGKYEEQVTRGVAVLRKLKVDIPTVPNPSTIKDAMARTSSIASNYSVEQITILMTGEVDARKKNILLCLGTVIVGAFRSSSPFLPLITCAVVSYSLQNGVCEDSAMSFACFGYLKIALLGDYNEGRYWANATKLILNKAATSMANTRVLVFLHSFVECWYVSLKETISNLLSLNKRSMAIGDAEGAVQSMLFSLRCSFYNGENLTILLQSHCELLRTMKRYRELAKVALVDVVMIESLVGTKSGAFDVFEGTIPTENFILADAQARQNIVCIELIHTRRFFVSFWFGDYKKANESYKTASSLPSSKMPKVWTIDRECYKAIIAFHLYAEGEGEEWLEQGMNLLTKFEFWTSISKDKFESKYLLLQAEYHVVSCDIPKAKASFEASIQSARDHGYTHEIGLAFERYGTFLDAIVQTAEALACYKSAHVCYMQWGAYALAGHIWNKYKLSTYDECAHPLQISSGVHKRST